MLWDSNLLHIGHLLIMRLNSYQLHEYHFRNNYSTERLEIPSIEVVL